MVAALTPLPVIGVPVKSSSLSGVDSLYSIVQMPRGIPVATVAIGNALNAALLAVRMLSIGDPSLLLAMDVYMKNAEKTVAAKAEKMTAEGLLYEVP
jgi:phosphoribosylaminoimidazole carboxylase PurE protein